MDNDTRERILEEVALLRREIANCAHCAALREQILNLLEMLPPEPLERAQLLEYLRDAER